MKTHKTLPRPPVRLNRMALVGVAYFALALVGLQMAEPGTNVTAIWAPTGLAIAAVLHYGSRVWPAILGGALLANLMVLGRLGLPTLPLLSASLATGLGNAAEALCAAWVIRRLTGTRHPFDRVTHVLHFILAVALGTGLGALAGATVFCAATGRWPLLQQVGTSWWLGDIAGALVVAPLLLTFRRTRLAALPLRIHVDALLAGVLVFAFWFGVCPLLPPLAFFFFPLLVLGTSRLGSFYGSALVALLSVLATSSALWGTGPFLLPGPLSGSLLLQQGFISTLAITTLVLASAFQERQSMEDKVVDQNRLYRTLLEVNQAIVHSEDRQTLLAETCRLLVEAGGFRMAWVGSKNQATGRVVPEASAGKVEQYLDDIVIRWDDSPEGHGPVGTALREEREFICQDCLTDPAFAPWRAKAMEVGYRTNGAFPIRIGGRVWGALVATHAQPQAIGAETGLLLTELAGDLGQALGALETRLDLMESERRFRATLENVQLVAISLDTGGTVTFCNDHFLRVTGWGREEVLGSDWFQSFLPPASREAVREALDPASPQGLQLHNENHILTRTGEPRLIRWNNTFLRDRAGAITGTVSLGEDITDQKRAEEALVAHAANLERRVAERTARLREANADLATAVERAQAADQAKSAFLSAMSHELRTPLNSVIGFTGVLLGGMAGPLRPEQEEPLRIVQRNGRHLLELINDVLDLSKIEAEEMRLAQAPFDLVEVLRESVESMGPTARTKGLSLEADFAVPALPLCGDRRRVAQILLNLLSNAVKFTEQGGVTLGLRVEQGSARVAVRDTGPGIAPGDLPRLFREFEQLDTGLARRNEGTGLGLALSQRLARLMDGGIDVESELGRGSTFTFHLPLKGTP